ncbi:MAG: hypothetical protein A2504_14145 [Bdellovibrionales bacterium RIFOXYD12_FULL_39_22]|nr:MAG: hypothetical protein A2385_04580 [Bdellovibrionales bacterium RIFOXYB1_FULL_39_21]OFZ43424.1 MAG: hypothetical protein A2485_13095 [Bdellovibrionales bacterium RIFOXYC12_FULL_39_17]OFZ46967.1 MAG: hypothetical protein A2404_00155 [Bdellovibrionales bacterium RIFOXYC1_FULL_39_130]OFZ76164.1 MAG: hypothetical protein A2560_07405 [Bdellovibrionales bacterium RIFOXYD1_FULL_39_84]OFZ94399.1 MAG: hypothetical protein A2504_14145 [Bdellovibrionales bacterium RIFOXYD12_FULL_39_22]HLE10561.1 ta
MAPRNGRLILREMRTSNGFTLIEILTSAALLALIAVAVSSLFKTQMEGVKQVETRYDILSIQNEIESILLSGENCLSTISPLQNDKAIEHIVSGTTAKFIAGSEIQYGSSRVKILSYNADTTQLENNKLNITVTFEKGNKKTKKAIELSVDNSDLKLIASCNSIFANKENEILKFGPPGTDGVYIDGELNLGIKTENPGAALDVAGAIKADSLEIGTTNIGSGGLSVDSLAVNNVTVAALITSSSASFSTLTVDNTAYTSDERLKSKIDILKNSSKKIEQLQGVSYYFRDNPNRTMGLIAQQVETVYPELVHTDNAGVKGLNYIGLIAPMIETIKEQNVKIRQQDEAILNLQKELKNLKKAIKHGTYSAIK